MLTDAEQAELREVSEGRFQQWRRGILTDAEARELLDPEMPFSLIVALGLIVSAAAMLGAMLVLAIVR